VLPPIEEIPDRRTYWALSDTRSIEKIVANFRIPKRFNHFVRWHQGRPRPIDPLLYLGEEPMISYSYESGYVGDEPEVGPDV